MSGSPTARTAQPPATPPQAQPPAAGVDEQAVRQHLTAAREALAQLTALPAAAQLQGEPRNQVAQLISNFNELITAKANWPAEYGDVEKGLTVLLGPVPSTKTEDPVVTTGSGMAIDPAIRTKLAEMRTHMMAFARAAGIGAPGA
jgi:hypothetical protein